MNKLVRLSSICTGTILIFLTVYVVSCRKSDRANDTELQSSQDFALAYASWMDVFRQTDAVASIQADVNRLVPAVSTLASCAVITVNPALPSTVYPKLVTIDFGAGCTGPDGIFRSGQILANFSGKYRDSLSVITLTPNNYSVGGVKLYGTCVITNKGIQGGHHSFTETVNNGIATRSDGKTISWNSSLNRTWIGGESTLNIVSDDIYQIAGTGNGTGINGNTFTVKITTPLHLDMSCHWIESGTLQLSPANLGTRIIDFGSGVCDSQATVSIFGTSYTIALY